MRQLLPVSTLFCCMVLLTPALPAQEPSPEGDGWAVALGDPAPPFELPDVDGNLHTLEEFAGHPLVVVFWGTW